MLKRIEKIVFIISLLTVFSCSEEKKEETSYEDTVIESTIISSQNDVQEYLDITYKKFKDTIDAKSGFLGYKNIRDYLSLGKETMNEKTKRVWFSIYDSKKVTSIIESHLEEAYIAIDKKKLNQIEIKEITGEKQVELYAHKVSLSMLGLIIEEILEFFISLFAGMTFVAITVFLYVTYQFSIGGWIRWSTKRYEKVHNLIGSVTSWTSRIVFVIFIIVSFYNGDLTENQLKNKIEQDILNEVEMVIKDNLK